MHKARNNENIAAVAESIRENRDQSIHRRSQGLGISYGMLWRILRHDLGLKAYKIQLVQELKPGNLGLRFNFG